MSYGSLPAWTTTSAKEVNASSSDRLYREQLAAILYRYAQNEGYKTSQSGKGTEGYLDASSISSYAVKAMDWAVNAGLLSGKGNNTLVPTAGATRAEVAQIFMMFCQEVAKQSK